MRVYLGLGSNLGDESGDRLAAIGQALNHIEALENTSVLAVSSAYESESWPAPEAPRFVNAVAVIETALAPLILLDAVKDIESRMGRNLAAPPNAPRPIDIDILLAEDEKRTSGPLVLPHPRLAERDFVIRPLLEVDPTVRWPDGSAVTDEAVTVGRVTARLGAIPGFGRPTTLDEGEGGAQGYWETVLSYGSDPTPFSSPTPFVLGGSSGQIGLSGQVEGNLAELVLTQEGIEWIWEPFSPELSSDPYGFQRHFQLKVPAVDADRARALLDAVASAPIDWSEAGESMDVSGIDE